MNAHLKIEEVGAVPTLKSNLIPKSNAKLMLASHF